MLNEYKTNLFNKLESRIDQLEDLVSVQQTVINSLMAHILSNGPNNAPEFFNHIRAELKKLPPGSDKHAQQQELIQSWIDKSSPQ